MAGAKYHSGMTTAVYAGTFDPVTFGHTDLARRAASAFDRLIVTTTCAPGKHPVFSLDERLDLLHQTLGDVDNITIEPFEGLLVDFATSRGATVLVRGVRAASDFIYEFEMAMMNRTLQPELETVFFSASPQFMFVSSSLIREIAQSGGNIDSFVPEAVRNAIMSKLGR